jgi:hypothetical protein
MRDQNVGDVAQPRSAVVHAPGPPFRVDPGKSITFKGCTWHDGWEFGAPLVLYAPVQRYFVDSGPEHAIEEAAIGICLAGPEGVPSRFSMSELREFGWRGWNWNRFAYRKTARHFQMVVHFLGSVDDMVPELGDLEWTQPRAPQGGPQSSGSTMAGPPRWSNACVAKIQGGVPPGVEG